MNSSQLRGRSRNPGQRSASNASLLRLTSQPDSLTSRHNHTVPLLRFKTRPSGSRIGAAERRPGRQTSANRGPSSHSADSTEQGPQGHNSRPTFLRPQRAQLGRRNPLRSDPEPAEWRGPDRTTMRESGSQRSARIRVLALSPQDERQTLIRGHHGPHHRAIRAVVEAPNDAPGHDRTASSMHGSAPRESPTASGLDFRHGGTTGTTRNDQVRRLASDLPP